MNLEKIRAAAERVARSEGLEVFDIEWKVGKERFLRVYIDRVPQPKDVAKETASAPGGVEATDHAQADSAEGSHGNISHADCERVSQQLSVILDVENLIEGPAGYVLEVSSPGVDRPLTEARHWRRATGRLVTAELGGASVTGRVLGAGDGGLRLDVDGTERVEPWDRVGRGRVQVEFNRTDPDNEET